MRGQLRHALWAGKWRGRYLHPCNKNRGKGDPAQIINFLLIIYFNSKHSCPSCCRLSWFPVSGIGRRRRFDPRPGPGVQRPDQQPWLCQAVCQQRYFTCETNTKTKSRVPTVNQTRQKLFLDLKKCFEISKKIVISKKVFGPKKCFGNSKHALGSKKIVDIVDNVAMLILLMQSGTTPGSN